MVMAGTNSNSVFQTVEGIQTHPLFKLLSVKQQRFLVRLLETNGDKLAAVEAIGSDTKHPEIVAMRMIKGANISKLLNIYYGYSFQQSPMSKSELLSILATRLRNPKLKDIDFQRLVQQYTELAFPKKEKPTKASSDDNSQDAEPSINDLVLQLEKQNKS
jgi:hypothetical protein